MFRDDDADAAAPLRPRSVDDVRAHPRVPDELKCFFDIGGGKDTGMAVPAKCSLSAISGSSSTLSTERRAAG
jgi:hypothetical protein